MIDQFQFQEINSVHREVNVVKFIQAPSFIKSKTSSNKKPYSITVSERDCRHHQIKDFLARVF